MKLTVVFADTFSSEMSVVHLGESRPYKKRTVSIYLTPEQADKLKAQSVGTSNGKERFEEIFECFLEE